MFNPDERREYFLRLEVYIPKNLRNYWPLLLDSLKDIAKCVSTGFGVGVYEGFQANLFHEEELKDFIHASIHFSKLRSLSTVDEVIEKVLGLSEFVEVYLSVKGDGEVLQKVGEKVYIQGISIRVLKYPEKGVCTLVYRLFKQNKGMRLATRVFSRASRNSTLDRIKRFFGLE
jgi:hypothetical protein